MAFMRDPVGHASDLVQQGRLPEAREALRRVLEGAPAHAEALHLAGMVEMMAGDPAAAAALLRRCVEAAPRVAFAWINLGIALGASGDPQSALESFRRALELQPGNAAALKNQGSALRRLGRHEDAMASFRRAAQREPNDAELHREVGDLLVDMGRAEEALSRYDRALLGNPRDAIAHHNRGFACWTLGRLDRAEQDYRRAIEIDPASARAHSSLGVALNDQGRHSQALECHAHALEVEPGNPQFHNNVGIALDDLGRREAAIEAYTRALAIDPAYAEALENRGAALNALRRYREALADYERAHALAPGLPYNAGHRHNLKLKLCDWQGLVDLEEGIRAGIAAGRPEAQPFPLCYVALAPALRLEATRAYARRALRACPPRPWTQPAYAHERIRVGYFSNDLRAHPVGDLLAPLVEAHDRARCETFAFSFCAETGDATRERLRRAFEHFHDVRAEPALDVAAMARRLGIDVAIDLTGYTTGARTAIFAHRAAPVQAQYLGFPGTMGAPCIDYLIADAVTVPDAQLGAYEEKIARLPGVGLVAEGTRPTAATPARSELGLPERAFVYASFCDRAKLAPDSFGSWMRILARVEGSILWLAHPGEIAARNLRVEAASRGIDPERIVYAPRVPRLEDHFARIRAADLLLDTFQYTGHVTTSDGLYAGVPVLTCMGDAFASRVSASLVGAAGTPELVAPSATEYEAMAVRLAGDAPTLASLRARVEGARASGILFDPRRLARDLEHLYERMRDRARRGLPPEHLGVGPHG